MTQKTGKYKSEAYREVEKVMLEKNKASPQADDLEVALLGAILIDRGALEGVIKDFADHLFHKHAHQIIAKAIIEMYAEGVEVDILTVTQKLKAMGKLEDVGGAHYVSTLTNRISSTANVQLHLRLLQEYSLRRTLIGVCGTSMQKAYANEEDVFDIYADLQARIDGSLKEVLKYEVSSIKSIHEKNIEESKVVAESGHKSGVTSGLKLLDNLTSGWQKSDFIILAGRPSMGKTACAISMVIEPSVERGVPIAVFSLEMSSAQLGGRVQSILSSIDVSKIIKKQLVMGDILYMEEACKKLLTAPLYIDDTPNISLIELKSKARRLVRENGVQLIVIDYLQLMRSGLNINNREQEIAEISRGLKGLAKELDIPIVALSQLSRLVEGRADKKPQLSDLRESGQIEQDADMVMFCYRPEYYGINTYEIDSQTLDTNGLFLLLVSKHRNGELGEIPLKFTHHLAKIGNHPNWSQDEATPKWGGGGDAKPNTDFLSQGSASTPTIVGAEDDLPY